MPEPLHCGLPKQAPLLPKLRGYFAEFLNNSSLAHLRILSSSTCVGLRYGHLGTGTSVLISGFSWQREISRFSSFASPSQLNVSVCGFTYTHTSLLGRAQPTARSTYPSASPLHSYKPWWYRNLYLLSIAYSFRSRLRSRLTLRGRTFLRKP